MRAMWKGSVSFGLVNVPVKMYTATQSNDVSFHQVHREDGGRIRYKRICSVCGEEVPYDEIAKGYEADDGQLVILTDEDLADLPVHGSREIEVERFVPAEQIDPLLLEKSYYLSPENTGRKPYALLREVLRADRPDGPGARVDPLALDPGGAARARRRDRAADDDVAGRDPPARLREPARQLGPAAAGAGDGVARWSTPSPATTSPEEFVDDYREAVETMIDNKLRARGRRGGAGREGARGQGGGEVIDLLAALQKSVDEASARRGGGSSSSGSSAKKAAPAKKSAATSTAKKSAPAKKTAAKKTAAKKTAAKKTTAKKTAARKSA